jgi:NAD(P)-dependent dehydrogenase (short-subunit alcohol dehydrogenase family)
LLSGTFELCSEGHLDRRDVAAIIGKVLGRDIKAERIDPRTAAAAAGGQAAGLKKMFDWYDARGLLGCALTLRAILGREPRTLSGFLKNSPSDPERRNEPDRSLVVRQARCAMVDANVTPVGTGTKTRHGDIVRADGWRSMGKREMKQNRIAVITGAAGGMGALLVERFLANCDTVIATDTSEAALNKLANKLDAGARLRTMAADISDEASCANLAAFARDNAGHVDVLINCAGFFPTQSFDEMSLADWNKVIGINLTGVFLMVKAVLPLMRGRGWGRIVNIGSGSMFEGVAEQTHYVAEKTGVLGFSRSLARVVGTDGITVNVVAPGLTITPAVARSMPAEMIKAQVKARAIQRDEKGEDLVGTVFFLASPDADFMSGQTLNVDGGKHML